MSATDISRYLHQPLKRYAGVRLQQGRVVVDSDWNEAGRLLDEDLRRMIIDILCAKGTSNGGFAVDQEVTNSSFEVLQTGTNGNDTTRMVETYDLRIAPGSFYIGGRRHELDQAVDFLDQPDWLRLDMDPDAVPVRPGAGDLPNGQRRYDLVYLHAWQQNVTAVEDSEILEPALCGPDTSTRLRRAHRIEVLTSVAGSCAAAFAQLRDQLTAPLDADDSGTSHRFDDSDCSLRSKARLTVGLVGAGAPEDLCSPEVGAGYIGAENQAIRVQLPDTNRLIWGYNNASPFYRVVVESNSDGYARVRFLTTPRDEPSRPVAGQAVEIIPWGALLPNVEKVAEGSGHLTTVATTYDPTDDSLTIADPLPDGWIDWFDRHPEAESPRDDEPRYFYLRLWTGGSGDASAPDHEFTPGTPLELAGTGLNVSLSDFGLPGDTWIIAARPHTPAVVTPWEIIDEAAPVNPAHHYAPLALVVWSLDDGGTPVASVIDCRATFQKLCSGDCCCCTIRVGDGVTSTGDVQSIQEAVDRLPESGGEICLLPGIHRANVEIRDRERITITGCDKRSVCIPEDDKLDQPVFAVVDSRCITIRNVSVLNLTGPAIAMEGGAWERLDEINVADNRIASFGDAVSINLGTEVTIESNTIRMLDLPGGGVAIRLRARQARIEHNDIGLLEPDVQLPEDDPDEPGGFTGRHPCFPWHKLYHSGFKHPGMLREILDRPPATAEPSADTDGADGGIVVESASREVRIIDNDVEGGTGDGIHLGSLVRTDTGTDDDENGSVDSPAADVYVRDSGTVNLRIEKDGKALPNTHVALDHHNTRASGSTGAKGEYSVRNVRAGTHRLTVVSPGYAIREVSTIDTPAGQTVNVSVGTRPVDPKQLPLVRIRDVEILDNRISSMGASGIGMYDPTSEGVGVTARASLLGRFGTPVSDLRIVGNSIMGCFNREAPDTTMPWGFGGISLGMVDNPLISRNRIARNGRALSQPACGIFFFFGEQVEVDHNQIWSNGPNSADVDSPATPIGGGIVGIALSIDLATISSRTQKDEQSGDLLGRPAARIIANDVRHRVGHALRLISIGDAHLASNHLATTSTGTTTLERIAAATLVVALGDTGSLPSADVSATDNRLWWGGAGAAFFGHVINTTDDLCFLGNRVASGATPSQENALYSIATFLQGNTLRASDCWFQERTWPDDQISLLSYGQVYNSTTDNHATCCVVPVSGFQTVDRDNLAMTCTIGTEFLKGYFTKFFHSQ